MSDRVQSKAGWRTTEAWLSTAVTVAGGVMVWAGIHLPGAIVMTVAVVGYTAARAFEKRASHAANGEIIAAESSGRSRVV